MRHASSSLLFFFAPAAWLACAGVRGLRAEVTPPTSKPVVVTILDVKAHPDVDTDVLWVENRADVYGFVRIGGESFDLPLREGSDHPYWHGNDARFKKEVPVSEPVKIEIEIWEDDGVLNGDDQLLDASPEAGRATLRCFFDLCSLRVTGDTEAASQGIIEVAGDTSGENKVTVRFTVSTEDGRPATTEDVALAGLDLVQVVSQPTRLAVGKETVLFARLANNFTTTVDTELRVEITAGGAPVRVDTFPVTLPGCAETQLWLYRGSPLLFYAASGDVVVNARIDPKREFSKDLKTDDCRVLNDFLPGNPPGLHWPLITTRRPALMWGKASTLLDVSAGLPDPHLDEIANLGHPYVEAVFPIQSARRSVVHDPPLVMPATGVFEFLALVLEIFHIPADALVPVVLTFELNGLAGLLSAVTPVDTIMGVLPSADWFRRFPGWEDVRGFSLGPLGPRAVIFLPRAGDPEGPQLAVGAHELGHTCGLSVDPRLKDNFGCDLAATLPIPEEMRTAICGIAGGLDEYKAPLEGGNASAGFWVRRGTEPTALLAAGMVDAAQRAPCLMGGSPPNAHLDWATNRTWIDSADYDRLLDCLQAPPEVFPPPLPPPLLFVSGMIDHLDHVYFPPWYEMSSASLRPDRAGGSRGLYGLRFLNAAGQMLSETGLPVQWAYPDCPFVLPVTLFGLFVEMPAGSKTIQIWRRGTTPVLLAKRTVSDHAPEVKLTSPAQVGNPIPRGQPLDIKWTASDADGDPLEFSVFLGSYDPNSPSGAAWAPVAHRLAKTTFLMPTDRLHTNTFYWVKVVASDGIHLGLSDQAMAQFSETPGPARLDSRFAGTGGRDFVLGFATDSSHTYRIDRADTPGVQSWVPLQSKIQGSGGYFEAIDPGALGRSATGFYRVVQEPGQ